MRPPPRAPEQGGDGQMGLERRGSQAQAEPQTCAHRDVRRLVQRNLPSPISRGEDSQPSPAPCRAPSQRAHPAFQIRVLTSRRPGLGRLALTASSILQVRSLRVSGKERRLPCTKNLPLPSAARVSRARRRGQVIHTFSQHPAPLSTLWALDGKTSNPALNKKD